MNARKVFLILAVLLLLGFMVGAASILKNNGSPLIQPVSAGEIYPLFFCPCCGAPLDKNNICCEQARERITYIDSLTAAGESKDAIILAYAKKYGLGSFVDENQGKEFKEQLIAQAPASRPIISLISELYDFGDVSETKGIVTTLFELKNEGQKDLIIDKLDSSCGCTSASVIFKGEEGPRYAMAGHGIENPTDWEIVIPPGESAQLNVYYDPSIHKGFRGPATREISVFSNDPINFEKKVTVELNQVD